MQPNPRQLSLGDWAARSEAELKPSPAASTHENPEKRKRGRPKGIGKGLPRGKPLPMSERIATFWSRVKKGNPDDCWPWTGYIEKETGYGKFTWGSSGPTSSHRFAWIATYGEISEGVFVCHKCDNRVCQNPNHLFLGTATDNNRDMFRKGRGANPPSSAKITVEQVRLIRAMWKPQVVTMRMIASKLNVTIKCVESAIRKWRRVPWN